MARPVPGAAIDNAFDALYARLFAVGPRAPLPMTPAVASPPPAPPPKPAPAPAPPPEPKVVSPPPPPPPAAAPRPPPPAPRPPPIDRIALRKRIKEILMRDDVRNLPYALYPPNANIQMTVVKRSALREELTAKHGYDFAPQDNERLLRTLVDEVVEELNEEEAKAEAEAADAADDASVGDDAADEDEGAAQPAPPPPPSVGPSAPKAAVKREAPSAPSKGPRKRAPYLTNCGECFRRHRQCERVFPCKQCVERGLGDTCALVTDADRRQRRATRYADRGGRPRQRRRQRQPEVTGDDVFEFGASSSEEEEKPPARRTVRKSEEPAQAPAEAAEERPKKRKTEAKAPAPKARAMPPQARLRLDGAAQQPKEWHGPPRLPHLRPDTDPCTQLLVYRPRPSRDRRLIRFTWRGSLYTTEALPALQANNLGKTIALLWALHATERKRPKKAQAPAEPQPSGAVFLRRNTTRRPAPAYLDADTEFYSSPSRINKCKRR